MAKSSNSVSSYVRETIVNIDVSEEMRNSFLEYAYSVIYARALPDARDGMKPVQRRILFQMSKMGLNPNRGHVKSSKVVGDVMGKLHPHGDSAIYDAMVRLAQDFSLRVPLIDGHGNFGSLDDGPAAPRYTEVRMSAPAMAMVADLDEDTVDMEPNYDASLLQPTVIPSAIPALLVNGAQGIAVGMATNMPPHNLVEVCSAAQHLLQNPDCSVDDLMQFVPGPDLPMGGKIVGLEGVREAYRSGRGAFTTQATYRIENVTARKKGIVFTELPYQVGPEKVIKSLKTAVQAGKVKGVTGVANLSDRHHGLRLVVEVKNGFHPEAVLAQLYKHTCLEERFNINNVALVDGQPQTLGLKQLLEVFLKHRQAVVRRRSTYRLNQANNRLHLVSGLLIAILDIDRVIAIIRAAEDAASARNTLCEEFSLSFEQAEHILQLRLRRLTKFSRLELETQKQELLETIKELEAILGSAERIDEVVSAELQEVCSAFGSARRTILLESPAHSSVKGTNPPDLFSTAITKSTNSSTLAKNSSKQAASFTNDQLTQPNLNDFPLEVADDPCWVLLSSTSLLARTNTAESPSRQGPRCTHDALKAQILTTARADIGVVTSAGNIYRLSTITLPVVINSANAPSLAGGTPVNQLVNIEPDETVVGIADLHPDSFLTLVSRQGKVKRLTGSLPERKDVFPVISLSPDDQIVAAFNSTDNSELIFIASDAQILHFPASLVRPQGRSGQGISAMALKDNANIIGAWAINETDLAQTVVVTCASSSSALPHTGLSAKVSPLHLYPPKGRATGGVRCHRFLASEDRLDLAWVGVKPRAIGAGGQPVDLPPLDERRQGSSHAILAPIAYVG